MKTKAAKKKTAATKKPAAKKTTKGKAPAAAPVPIAGAPKADSKGGIILGLITRPAGASMAELAEATKWQQHSVRGFLSTASKKYNLVIVSTKVEGGRHYSAAGPTEAQ